MITIEPSRLGHALYQMNLSSFIGSQIIVGAYIPYLNVSDGMECGYTKV